MDQTGLDGFYEWELLWMELWMERSLVRRHVSEIYRPFAELLPLQMGMTLVATYAPVDIVVIDAISMPMAN